MDHGVGTLSACVITRTPHQGLLRITESMPHLTRVLWLLTLIDGAIMREWIVGLGRRTATERMAHLLCEIHLRLRAAGRNGSDDFQLPITQLDFGDILGLSAVHTNRVLQQLRAMNLVTWEGSRVRLLNRQALADLGGFDPQYLHQRQEPR
jgi:CRP-like cAMP-binding protein